jgi:hypothetical protein
MVHADNMPGLARATGLYFPVVLVVILVAGEAAYLAFGSMNQFGGIFCLQGRIRSALLLAAECRSIERREIV